MFSDKTLINRRNVNTDVSAKVDGCKKFFQLGIHARVIAAFCEVLGINSPDEIPSDNPMINKLTTATQKEKQEYLKKISSEVVDKFIAREGIHESVIKRQTYEDWLLSNNPTDSEGHFLCRSKGCPKTFKFDGKRRIEHEKLHGLHKEIEAKSSEAVQDDMFNYQCSLLDIGMIILNFYDAVSEGDGMRVVRCWKFMLPYLKNDGARSRKYALEALYLLCQTYGILSQRDGHRLIWNRFNKSKPGHGGNIPQDLALEHYNNLLRNVVKKLGPNATNEKVITRYCKAITVNKTLLENFDRSCKIIRRSGKHVTGSMTMDLQRVVKELMKHDALKPTPGRKYKFFTDMDPTLLQHLDVHGMYKWIQEHKDFIRLHKAGR